MAEIYADLIIEGEKTIDEVPALISADVEKILIERGFAL